MPDRLTPLDVSFLYLEEPHTAMHMGSVAVLDPPEGFDDDLVALIERRIARPALARSVSGPDSAVG